MRTDMGRAFAAPGACRLLGRSSSCLPRCHVAQCTERNVAASWNLDPSMPRSTINALGGRSRLQLCLEFKNPKGWESSAELMNIAIEVVFDVILLYIAL